jgi:hypothetical protein
VKVLENKVLRRIFGLKRGEMIGCWGETTHNLYFLPSVIRMVKSWRIRWTGFVVRMGKEMNAYRIFVANPEEKRPVENKDVGGRIILKWFLEKYDGLVWTGFV